MTHYSAYSNIVSATTKQFWEVDGNSPAWYDSQDLTTITKDGNQHVTKWANKLLVTASDLTTYGGTPHWSTDGILFDGIGDYLNRAFTWNQPCCIYMVMRQISWTNNDTIIYSGNGTNYLNQRTATPQFRAFAGTASGLTTLALNTFGIIRLFFNGASSKLQVNNIAAITGTFGAGIMGGITLGGTYAPAALSNVEFKEIVCRKIEDTAGDEVKIYNYLATKNSLPTI